MLTESKHKFACFIGHGMIEDKDKIVQKLDEIFAKLVILGYDEFLFGRRGDFDELAFSVAKKFRSSGAKIKLVYCFESFRQSRRADEFLRLGFDECRLLEFFDGSPSVLYFRNCAMIDASDLCVFCVSKSEASGAFKALSYAVKKNANFVNLAY